MHEVVLFEQGDKFVNVARLQLNNHENVGSGFFVGGDEVVEQGDGFAVRQGLGTEVGVVEVADCLALIGGIVVDNEPPVACLPNVELGAVDVERERFTEGGQRVLRKVCTTPTATMGDERIAPHLHNGFHDLDGNRGGVFVVVIALARR